MANDYGIRFGNLFRKSEWKAIKKELQKLDAKNDNFELTKADYKEIKAHIKAGDLGAYMDAKSVEIRQAMGLALGNTKAVDGTEQFARIKGLDGVEQAEAIIAETKLYKTDKAKVMQYILDAYKTDTFAHVSEQDTKSSNNFAYNTSANTLDDMAKALGLA